MALGDARQAPRGGRAFSFVRGGWAVLALLPIAIAPGVLTTQPALAADECGSGASVICASTGNPYGGGITYSTNNQTVTLGPGVVVTAPNGGLGLNGAGSQTANTSSGVTIGTTANGADAVYFYGAPTSVVIRAAGSSISTANSNAWGYNVGDAAGVPGSVDAIVGDVVVGAADASSTNVRGVFAKSTGSSVSITSGAVTARGTGNGVYGLYALAQSATGGITINAGPVVLSGGSTAFAIYAAASGGDVSVTAAGVSNTGSGALVGGILAGTTGAGKVTVDSTGGVVSLTGTTAYSTAISVSNGTGGVDVKTASITTAGTATSGLAVTTSATGSNQTVVNTSAGTITTTGTGAAYGISVSNLASSNVATIDITSSAISTGGVGAHGIYTASGGAVTITAGNITTTGGGADAIRPEGVGTVTISSQNKTLSTSGNGADGIRAQRTSANAVTVHAGTITTTGAASQGIHVFNGTYSGVTVPDGGAITITAQSVTTTGAPSGSSIDADADAISVYTSGTGANGRIDIDTSVGAAPSTLGLVKTTGDKARGIWAQSGWVASPSIPMGGGSITITAGNVMTEGESAEAIHAVTYGSGASGKVTVTALGSVATKGAGPAGTNGGPARGIEAISYGGGDVSVTTHDVTTLGDNATAIFAQTTSGSALSVDTRAGAVHTSGVAADGVTATFDGTVGVVTVRTAAITTDGNLSNGLNAFAGGAGASMLVDTTGGSILAKGSDATGVNVNANAFGGTAASGLVTVKLGDVRTEGTGSAASIQAGAGGMDVTVTGAISTVGTNSWGMSLTNKLSGDSTITVDGSITTTGATGHGIYTSTVGGTSKDIITINGSISATGSNAIGMILGGTGDSVTVAVGGSVRGNSAGIQFQEPDATPTSLTNAGTITGDAGPAITFLGASPSTLTNTGTINGNADLGGGADTAILGSGSIITGTVDGGSGTDTIRFTGTASGSFDASKATNFEVAEKTGTGTWTLTGTTTTLPNIDVQQGRLAVDGTLTSLTATLDSGSVLGGHGTLGSFSALSGAKVAPGNSIGTLTVATASFASGSVLEAELDATGVSDLLHVTGIATIAAGATVRALPAAGSYTVGQEFLVLDAGTRAGLFSGVTTDSAFLQFELDQTTNPNQVVLRLTSLAGLPTVAQTPNQIATAQGLESLGSGSPLVGAVAPLSAPAARAAFDQLSGEVHATATHALIDAAALPRQTALDRIDAAFAAIDASRAAHARNLWTRSYGNLGAVLADGNAASFGSATGGLLLGADGLVSADGFAGSFIGMGLSTLDVPDRSSSAEVTSYQLGLYGGTHIGQITLKAGATGSLDQAAIVRRPGVAGLGQTLTSSQTSLTGQLFGEIAYAFALEHGTVEPFAQLAVIGNSGGSYAESGGPAAVSGHASPSAALVATLGLRATTDFALGNDMVVHAHAMVGVQQQFGAAPTATHSFAGGNPFTVSSSAIGGTAVVVEAGASTALTKYLDLDLSYTGQLSGVSQSHAFKATLSGRF